MQDPTKHFSFSDKCTALLVQEGNHKSEGDPKALNCENTLPGLPIEVQTQDTGALSPNKTAHLGAQGISPYRPVPTEVYQKMLDLTVVMGTTGTLKLCKDLMATVLPPTTKRIRTFKRNYR